MVASAGIKAKTGITLCLIAATPKTTEVKTSAIVAANPLTRSLSSSSPPRCQSASAMMIRPNSQPSSMSEANEYPEVADLHKKMRSVAVKIAMPSRRRSDRSALRCRNTTTIPIASKTISPIGYKIERKTVEALPAKWSIAVFRKIAAIIDDVPQIMMMTSSNSSEANFFRAVRALRNPKSTNG